MRKPAFCIYTVTAQLLCVHFMDGTWYKFPLHSKSEISSLLPSSVAVQPGLCRTWSETPDRFSCDAAIDESNDEIICLWCFRAY